MRLWDGELVQEHIRKLTEVFEELTFIGDPMKKEDQVVHLPASLPKSFSSFVTALQFNPVHKMEFVTERLLHEERKEQDKGNSSPREALSVSCQTNGPRCFHSGNPKHFRRVCRQLKAENEKSMLHKGSMSGKNEASVVQHSSESDLHVLVVEQILHVGAAENWIVDSGATCHMCHNKKLFSEFQLLEKPAKVTLEIDTH